MVVKRDTDVVLDGDVDEPEAVLLALLDSDCVVRAAAVGVLVGTIDENVVSGGTRALLLQSLKGERIDLERSLVVPVVDHVRTKIEIVVGRGWTVEDNGSNDAITVL